MRTGNQASSRSRFLLIIGISVSLACSASLFAFMANDNDSAAKNQDDQPAPTGGNADYKIPENVEQLMQDRNYDAAIEAIDTAIGNADYDSDYLWYLKGRAQTFKEDYDAAVTSLDQMIAKFPESKLLRKAKLARGVALAKQGNFLEAEKAYKAEAEALVSSERRHELAMICVEYGDSYFEPTELSQQPDYAKAYKFYHQARLIGLTGENKTRTALRIARCLHEQKKYDEAIKEYRTYIKENENDPSLVEARFQLGMSQFHANQHSQARRSWQDLIDLHGKDEKKGAAQSPRIAEAAFRISDTYGFPNPSNKTEFMLGETSLRSFLEKYPNHEKAIDAELRICEGTRFGFVDQTIEHLKTFLANETYRENEKRSEGLFKLAQIYQDQKKFDLARETFTEYLKTYSSQKHWNDAQLGIVNCDFSKAFAARIDKDFDQAKQLWQTFMATYPLDNRNPEILLQLGSIEQERENFEKAIEHWRLLTTKYPGKKAAASAQLMIATTYEINLKDIDKAIEEYKKMKGTNLAKTGEERVAQLTSKNFDIKTTRTFRSNETPQIELNSRNVESFQVKVYRIDMETYFRKHQQMGGIEWLNIALIDPDHQFEYAIPEYKKYLRTTHAVDLKLPAELKNENNTGAWAVTISNESLESTTLVLQSDLETSVHTTNDSILVYAQNMLTGQPWPNARIVMSDGNEIIDEQSTNDDGVYLGTLDPEKVNAGRLMIVADGHLSANAFSEIEDIEKVDQHIALIHTDKSIYKPGELVNIRGVLRDQKDGRLMVPDSKDYELTILDQRQHEILKTNVTLDDFGVFHCNTPLSSSAILGNYVIQIRDTANTNQTEPTRGFTSAFRVAVYELDTVRVEINSDRSVYFRGEEITGTIAVRYYYGAPVVNKTVQYTLGNGDKHTGQTNEKGELEFTLPTRDLAEGSQYTLAVSVPQLNVDGDRTFLVAASEFRFGISTTRTIYLNEESFEVKVRAFDWMNKPIKTAVKIAVLDVNKLGAAREDFSLLDLKSGAVIQEFETTTDDSGMATQSISIEKSGTYAIRVTGSDRFKNNISKVHAVYISGENDTNRLRILVDQHTYRVGETAPVKVHWREEKTQALMMYSTERISKYKLVELNKGNNSFDIPLDADLSPGFTVAFVALTDLRKEDQDDYHFAQTEFYVKPNFNLEMKVVGGDDRESYQPGQEISVELTTTDSAGNAVPVSMSLAMTEEALLKMTRPDLDARDSYFEGRWYGHEIAANSSTGFAYLPATRIISPDVITEERRLALSLTAGALRDRSNNVTADQLLNAQIVRDKNWNYIVGNMLYYNSEQNQSKPQDTMVYYMGLVRDVVDLPKKAEFKPDSSITTIEENTVGFLALGGVDIQSQMLEPLVQGHGQMLGGAGSNLPGLIDRAQSMNDRRESRERAFLMLNGVDNLDVDQQGDFGNSFGRNVFDHDGPASIDLDGRIYGTQPAGVEAAEFDDLLRMVESTISADTWHASGGNGRIQPFPSNLSLVVSQSQKVHSYLDNDQIVLGKPQRSNDIAILSNGGVYNVVNLQYAVADANSSELVQSFVSGLNKNGFALIPQLPVSETGYWNPSITTDENGKATVKIRLPSRSTAWQLTAAGISKDTLTAHDTVELTVKQGLFGQLRVPTAYTDGDKTQTRVTVHNSQIKEGTINVELKTTIGDKTVTQTKKIDKELVGIHELVFENQVELPNDLSVGTGANVRYELRVTSGESVDLAERVIPIKPYGIDVYATSGGVSDATTATKVAMREGTPFKSPQMQIMVGPNLESSLYDVLLGRAPRCQFISQRFATPVERLTSDLLAGIALEKLHKKQHPQGSPLSEILRSRNQSNLLALISIESTGTGWSWTPGQPQMRQTAQQMQTMINVPRGNGSGIRSSSAGRDSLSSARALWAISAAREAGYEVNQKTMDRAIASIQQELGQASVNDYELKAVLLHALTVAGKSDFTLANQLYRNRNSLSAAALSYLALTFAEMDRKNTATEIVAVLNERNVDGLLEQMSKGTLVETEKLANLSANRSVAELRALYALAIERSSQDENAFKKQRSQLLDIRNGNRWAPDKATGPATMALASSQSRLKSPLGDYSLKISVNDKLLKEIVVKKDSQTQILDVPAELLKAGADQDIRFELEGRGEFAYQCILSGFVGADVIPETNENWTVQRSYQPSYKEIDGRTFQRGFRVVNGSDIEFKNNLSELPIGNRGMVELEIKVPVPQGASSSDSLDYLVVSEPIPAGASVIERSITGNFQHYEILPGEILFYVGASRQSQISFELIGVSQGDYRAGPTVVRNSFQLDQMAIAKAQPLRILAEDQTSSDEYRMSPDELYHVGLYYQEKGKTKEATEYLTKLLDNWNLDPQAYKNTTVSLFEMHLNDGGAPGQTVKFFETIIEKYPDHPITFESYLKVAQAYHEIGEYERSYLVYRATLEASFSRELTIPGFLLQEGEFEKSVAMIQQLIGQYPPESHVATARYALTQQVYQYASQVEKDQKLVSAGVNRLHLIDRAARMLDRYLVEYPNDPSADEASFSLANALLDLRRYDDAIAACEKFAQRYPDSDFLDSFWYMMGYCYFADGTHEKAIEMCQKVAEAKRIDPETKRETESTNKWRAIYILGQIYHSMGEAKKAIDFYQQVNDRFVDAQQAIEYFAREELTFDEVQTFKPGEKANVKLDYRNIHDCRITVYKIDLMKFSLLQRDLSNVTNINLSGIRPYHQADVQLKENKTYRDENKSIELPLKDDGAYLVVLTSDNLYASGMVLVSPLEIEVTEDERSGRARATLKNSVDGKYLDDVHIKAIGSNNKQFRSGETDLRGVFVADGLEGTVTVIAKTNDNQYAFYRGEKYLGGSNPIFTPRGPRQNQAGGQSMQQRGGDAAAGSSRDGIHIEDFDMQNAAPQESELLEDLKGFNQSIQRGNSLKMDKILNSKQGKSESGSFDKGGFGGGGILDGGK